MYKTHTSAVGIKLDATKHKLPTWRVKYLAAFGKVRPTSFSMSASTSSGRACSEPST